MNWINPTFWSVLLIAAIMLFGCGYAAGIKNESSICAADKAKEQQAAQEKADETTKLRDQIAQARETSREQIRIEYRTIREKAHETTVNADCSLDADGLRLWNAANAGTAATLCSQLDGCVPSTPSATLREVIRSAGQPHRGDGAVQPVPRPAEETGGVREGDAIGIGHPSASPIRGVRAQ